MGAIAKKPTIFYGWVIVAVSCVIGAIQIGTMYSYGVLFKNLTDYFDWSRAATSGVQSVFLITTAFFGFFMGWLADRFSPAKVMVACAFFSGAGLALTSQVNALWQIYLTYGLIFGIGGSASFVITTATTARWFIKYRGLALGIVVSGAALGTFLTPVVERLVNIFDWSTTCLILGIATWVIMIPSGLVLRRDPADKGLRPYGAEKALAATNGLLQTETNTAGTGLNLGAAVKYKQLWIICVTFFLINVCVQMIMLHLVNHATDVGITPLIAAAFLSVIGISSLIGRLLMGVASDRISANNSLLISCIVLMTSAVLLIFTREIWMFYIFAILFGFAYGGAAPQIAALIGEFFGLRAITTIVGVIFCGSNIGGAFGAWVGGWMFDLTQSYKLAFAIAAFASFIGILFTLLMKKTKRLPNIDRNLW
jgi:MFS family permease